MFLGVLKNSVFLAALVFGFAPGPYRYLALGYMLICYLIVAILSAPNHDSGIAFESRSREGL